MKTTRSAIAVFMLFSALSTNAHSSMQANEELERSAKDATARYAQSTKKPMPEVEDYAYGIKLDVSKLVYVSPKESPNKPSVMRESPQHLIRAAHEPDELFRL